MEKQMFPELKSSFKFRELILQNQQPRQLTIYSLGCFSL